MTEPIAGLHPDPTLCCPRCFCLDCHAAHWAERVRLDSWRGIVATREEAVRMAEEQRSRCEQRAEGGE